METIKLEGMDRLLPPVEQAKMAGLIKEPVQLQHEEKQKYVLYGVYIACALLAGCFMVQYIVEKNSQKKRQGTMEYDFYNDKI